MGLGFWVRVYGYGFSTVNHIVTISFMTGGAEAPIQKHGPATDN